MSALLGLESVVANVVVCTLVAKRNGCLSVVFVGLLFVPSFVLSFSSSVLINKN